MDNNNQPKPSGDAPSTTPTPEPTTSPKPTDETTTTEKPDTKPVTEPAAAEPAAADTSTAESVPATDKPASEPAPATEPAEDPKASETSSTPATSNSTAPNLEGVADTTEPTVLAVTIADEPAAPSSTTPTATAESTTPAAASSANVPVAKKPLNKSVVIIIAIAVVAIIAGIVAAILILNSNKDNGSGDKKPDSSQTTDKDDNKDDGQDDDKKTETKLKTLSIADLSVKYPAEGWEVDTSTDTDTSAISKGEDSYFMLAHTSEAAEMSTEDFADLSAEAYEGMGYDLREDAKKQTINGKDWQRLKLYGDGIWMTVLFLADGEDYYVVTYGNDSASGKVPSEVEDIIKTLTVK